MTTVGAPIDHFLVVCCFLPLPDLESDRDNQVLLDLFTIDFLRFCVAKSGHHSPRRNIDGHHGAAIPRRNGTPGLEHSCKGLRLVALGESQSDMVSSCLGHNPCED